MEQRKKIFLHLDQPDWGYWNGHIAPSSTIFFSSRSDDQSRVITGTKEKNIIATICNPETVAPRANVPVSLERARRALYAHFFVVQIIPIGAELYRFKGNKGKKYFCNNLYPRNCSSKSKWTGVIGKGSSRPLLPYFFCPDLTNRSRVIMV
ncbi:LOW QUALITY PROTEIN: hypothetical protein V1477_006255 [Vespula maculifrons]|uniref:Uncharacterized protein n=1 Tax=Vespula maculifrons TaxID=7453 RepID=A0ABD2CJY7_VESMC